jgi:hypothetical protein
MGAPAVIKPEHMHEDRHRLAAGVPTGEFSHFLWRTVAGVQPDDPVMLDPLRGQQVWNTVSDGGGATWRW